MSAICEHCLTAVPSRVHVGGAGAWMTKRCPEHGESRHLIEPDPDFFCTALVQELDPAKAARYTNISSATGIDITRRCNVRCPHCYVDPENQVKDIPLDDVVELARHATKAAHIILMGAEPTVRHDLPAVIEAVRATTGKDVGIYTNAIRAAKGDYAEQLKAAGLKFACVSLHTPGYLGAKIYEQKKQGINKIMRAGVAISHVSFSLTSLDELPGVLTDARALRRVAGHIRIRSPQQVGHYNGDEPIALSTLYNETRRILEARGHRVVLEPSDNSPYHVNVRVDGLQVIRLIRWPTLASAELSYLDCPPYAIFDKESGEVNLVLSFLMQEARRKQSRALELKKHD